MPTMKKGFFVFLLLVLFAGVVALRVSFAPPPYVPDASTIRIVASFYPVAEFARQVGGNLVDVMTVTPAGVEPHEYEPTSQQVAAMYDADVFLYNGGGVDAWAERIAPELERRGITTINMSDVVGMAVTDPHFWLDPVFAHAEVTLMKNTMTSVDPTHAVDYAQNADAYIEKLASLAADYANGLAMCNNRTVVTSHDAFAYLAARYNFDVIAISGISPEEEPSAGRLAEIAELAREQNISYIFFETLVSPRLSQTVADEIGASTLVFNPLEGLTDNDIDAGKNYVSVMQENLSNLRTAMVCQ